MAVIVSLFCGVLLSIVIAFFKIVNNFYYFLKKIIWLGDTLSLLDIAFRFILTSRAAMEIRKWLYCVFILNCFFEVYGILVFCL